MDSLEGVRILDLTSGLAGPAGILLLAEHGADVIKVEPPGGSPDREYHGSRVWNRSRRSVTLDLKSPEGKARFLELAVTADVIAESFMPGTMARLGLDYESLAVRFPRLVLASVPGWPTDSRHADRPGWDALVAARSGQQYEQPGWRYGPIFLGRPMPSLGAMFLVPTAVLAALHARESTGRGQHVEVSLLQGVLSFTSMLWVHTTERYNEAIGSMSRTYPPTIHQRTIFECADGEWIQSPGSSEKGVSLNSVLGIPDDHVLDMYGRSLPPTLTPAEMQETMAKAREELVAVYRTKKRDELVDRLHEDYFQAEAVVSMPQMFEHPQLVATDMVVTVDDPVVGPTQQMGVPVRLGTAPGSVRGPRPRPGQHNDEVFAELTSFAANMPTASRSPGHSITQPLEGVTVLDFGRAFAGPFAAMVLAGLGANVIKVHPVDGAGMMTGSVLLGCEQGKRSLAINLKHPEGLAIAHRLVQRSDVLHHNMTLGVAERLGIDYPTLKRINPGLIYCNTFMYGPVGPLAHLGGQDPLGQAAGGVEWDGGPVDEGNPPLWSRFGMGDTANALASVVGVMLALAHRDRTGDGQYVWTSILHSLAYYGADVHLTPGGAIEGPKLDKRQTGLGATYRLYETQGGWIQVAALSNDQWTGLCNSVGRADLATDERFATPDARRRSRAELEALLEPIFTTNTAVQWRRRLDAAGVPSEIPIETLDGEPVLFDDEYLRLGIVAELEHPAYGRVRQVGNLMTFSDTPGRVERSSPIVGQHTREVLRWLDYDDAAIEGLQERDIVACNDI